MSAQRFMPYPAYKESGVEWLGEIPAGWGLKPLKRIVAFRGGGTPSKANLEYWNGDIPWVSPKDMKVSVVEETEDKITTEAVRKSATKLIPAGAVLIVVRSGILVHSIPVAVAGREVTLNQDLKALIPGADIAAQYLMYLISGMQRELLVEWKKEGATVESLELDFVADTPTPLPDTGEQRAIAAFLDRETARIDALVAKKERLIELLQEQRTALITRAVSKGLDPNVPMKDSGVEWLGEIPAHWGVKHLRWAIMFQRGHDLPTDAREDGQVPVVSSSGISSTHSRAVAKAPGIVTGRYGTIGHFHLIWQDFWPLNTTLYSIDLRRNDPRFLRHMLEHLSPLFLLNAVKSAVPGVDRNDIHPTITAVPPLREQLEIADFLDAKSAQIAALGAKVREAIDRLKELRTALISAAVTGKIDVREDVA